MRTLIRESVIGLISGYIGLKIMDPVTTKLHSMTSEADKEQEKRVSPGVAYDIAARDLAGHLGLPLNAEDASQVATFFHLGLGLAGGEMYMALRRVAGLGPVPSAVLMSMLLFLGVDEGLNAAMGWSAPPNAYPLSTHVRGLVGHLVLGAATAISAECLDWLEETSPGS